jgi:hypothetical protein
VDGAVRFWSPTTGRPIRTPLIGHTNCVNAVPTIERIMSTFT